MPIVVPGGGGGGSLPANWTVEASNLTIDDVAENAAAAIGYTPDGFGYVTLLNDGGNSFIDADGATIRLGTGVFDVLRSVGTAVMEAGDAYVVVQGSLYPTANPGQTDPIIQVADENGNPVFEIRVDGTVHIKTGGAVVADL